MIDDQSRENLDSETDIAVGAIRNRNDHRDPRIALDKVIEKLNGAHQVYFHFIAVQTDDTVPQWMLRLGKKEGEMKDEAIAVIHVCRPLGLWEAVETSDPARTIAHSGYVKQGACVRCHTPAPPKVDKKFTTVEKLMKLGKAIS